LRPFPLGKHAGKEQGNDQILGWFFEPVQRWEQD